MANLEDFIPKSDEQMFISGMKGSGKTHFAKSLLSVVATKEVVIFVDTKPDFKESELVDFDDKNPLYPHRLSPKLWFLERRELGKRTAKGLYVYRNSGGRRPYDDPFIDTLITWAMKDEKKKVTLYFDEGADLSHSQFTTPLMDKVLRQSRSRNVRLMIGTQRPKGIPSMYVNQADKIATFFMLSKSDRKHLADNTHPAMINPPDGAYSFWYYETPKKGKPIIKHIRQQ